MGNGKMKNENYGVRFAHFLFVSVGNTLIFNFQLSIVN